MSTQAAACGLLALLAVLAPGLVNAQQDRAAVEARLEAVRAEIAAIRQRVDDRLAERDRMMRDLADAERAAGNARRAQREAAQALAATDERIELLKRRRGGIEREVGEHGARLATQLATAYRQGHRSRLKTVLDQDDPRTVARRLAYFGYFSRARLEAIENLRASLVELERTRRSLDGELERQRELLAAREAEAQRLERAMAQRSEALAALENELEGDRRRLAALERDAEELDELLEELATVLADVPPELAVTPFRELRGRLPMPVSGRVREAFGSPRGAELEWTGWLIEVEPGREVRAVAHGRVAYADWLRGYGLLLIIDHGDEYMSLYAHNDSLMRDVGDWVAPGEVIAISGISGGIDDAALYFELRSGGRPVDPATWISR